MNLHAQTTSAAINGQVTDSQGRIVPGVEVQAVNIDTNAAYPGKTNDSGIYAISALPPGRYRLLVLKDGFKEINKTGLVLHVQDTLQQNFALEVGSISESVTVEAGGLVINTTDATVSTVVDRNFIESIPLNGRSLQALITLAPGVVLTPVTPDQGQGQFSVNGQRSDANYFTVDGVSANTGVNVGDPSQSAAGSSGGFNVLGGTNSLVSIDAIQEFRIQTSSFAPEFGRTPGGQISIATRSGTNQFHGDVFDYFRNDVLDANDWFADSKELPKAALRQNDFGGVLGGPIFKDRTFFFFSYEGLRLVQPETGVATLPTVAFRRAAPANIQPLLNALPIPNGTDFGNGSQEFDSTFSNRTSLDATSIRLDQRLTSKITLFGRYNYAPSQALLREPSFSNLFALTFRSQTVTVGSSQAFSPSVTNDVRFNYSSNDQTGHFSLDNFGGAVPVPLSSLVPSSVSSNNAFVGFSIGGAGNWGLGKQTGNSQKQWNLIDAVSISDGTHQLKVGVDYRRLLPSHGPIEYQLALGFSQLNGGAAVGGVDSTLPEVNVNASDPVAMVFDNFSAYGQDTWKLSAKLTLTYGLRWELNPAFHGSDRTPLYTLANLGDLANLSLARAGTPFYKTTYYNFAPRVGVAYQVRTTPGRETVIRGGGGIFYDLGAGTLANGGEFFPYSRQNQYFNQQIPFPLPPNVAAPPPFSTTVPPGGSFFTTATEPHLQLPRTYEWNVAIEQAIGPRQRVSATYLGAAGRQLLNQNELTAFPASGNIVSILEITNRASSDYNALQLQYQLRLARGLQALGYYAWSHSIDTLSTDVGNYLSNPTTDRGNSSFDIRNAFHAAVTYDVPTGPFGRVGKAILGNWSIDTNVVAQSAVPVDLQSNLILVDASLTSFVTARPDVVRGQPFYLHGSQYPGGKAFNPAAFQDPPAGGPFGSASRQGTLARNALRGFGIAQLDFSLRRKFNLTERINLQFSTEFFNILNHPNFGSVDRCICDSPGLFGQATTMFSTSLSGLPSQGAFGGFNALYQVGGPRSIQLALKFLF